MRPVVHLSLPFPILRFFNFANPISLLFPVEVKFDRDFAAGVVGWQGAECINAFQCAHGGNVQRRHAAGLFYLYIRGLAAPSDVERYVDAAALTDSRIYFVLELILGNFLLHYAHVIAEAAAEISCAAGEGH